MKKSNSWYRNYDAKNEMVKEMKKDYEKNKESIFDNLKKAMPIPNLFLLFLPQHELNDRLMLI